jgi:hypothetical protein
MDSDLANLGRRPAALARRESFFCGAALVIVLAWYAYSNVRSNSDWAKPYPTTPAQIQVGANTFGASSCSEKFTGELVRMEFLGAVQLP